MLVCVSAFFLIGSIGCSYAASFSQLLVSRVIAGLGGGGSTVMILTVLHDLLPPRIRGQYQSYTYTAQTVSTFFFFCVQMVYPIVTYLYIIVYFSSIRCC